uniref:Secreted protein n=1 Tax=Steinernema glaseri TaxID=37863 RepID=A0A1I8APG9_9BILA
MEKYLTVDIDTNVRRSMKMATIATTFEMVMRLFMFFHELIGMETGTPFNGHFKYELFILLTYIVLLSLVRYNAYLIAHRRTYRARYGVLGDTIEYQSLHHVHRS